MFTSNVNEVKQTVNLSSEAVLSKRELLTLKKQQKKIAADDALKREIEIANSKRREASEEKKFKQQRQEKCDHVMSLLQKSWLILKVESPKNAIAYFKNALTLVIALESSRKEVTASSFDAQSLFDAHKYLMLAYVKAAKSSRDESEIKDCCREAIGHFAEMNQTPTADRYHASACDYESIKESTRAVSPAKVKAKQAASFYAQRALSSVLLPNKDVPPVEEKVINTPEEEIKIINEKIKKITEVIEILENITWAYTQLGLHDLAQRHGDQLKKEAEELKKQEEDKKHVTKRLDEKTKPESGLAVMEVNVSKTNSPDELKARESVKMELLKKIAQFSDQETDVAKFSDSLTAAKQWLLEFAGEANLEYVHTITNIKHQIMLRRAQIYLAKNLENENEALFGLQIRIKFCRAIVQDCSDVLKFDNKSKMAQKAYRYRYSAYTMLANIAGTVEGIKRDSNKLLAPEEYYDLALKDARQHYALTQATETKLIIIQLNVRLDRHLEACEAYYEMREHIIKIMREGVEEPSIGLLEWEIECARKFENLAAETYFLHHEHINRLMKDNDKKQNILLCFFSAMLYLAEGRLSDAVELYNLAEENDLELKFEKMPLLEKLSMISYSTIEDCVGAFTFLRRLQEEMRAKGDSSEEGLKNKELLKKYFQKIINKHRELVLAESNQYQQDEEYKHAIVKYSELLDPKHQTADDIEIMLRRAECYFLAQEYKSSINDFTDLLARVGDDQELKPELFLLRAKCFYANGEYERGVADCNEGLKLKRLDNKLKENLVFLRTQCNDTDTASKKAVLANFTLTQQSIEEVRQSNAENSLQQANRLQQGGEHKEAIEAYSKVLDPRNSNTNNPAVTLKRAECYFAIQEYSSCITDCSGALSIPKLDQELKAAILFLRAKCYFADREDDKGKKDCEAASKLIKANSELKAQIKLQLAVIYLNKDRKRALKECDYGLALLQDYTDLKEKLLFKRAECFYLECKYSEAAAEASFILDRYKTTLDKKERVSVLFLRAKSYLMKKHKEKDKKNADEIKKCDECAKKDFDSIKENFDVIKKDVNAKDYQPAQLLFTRAERLFADHQYDEAIDDCSVILKLYQSDLSSASQEYVLFLRGECFLRQGKIDVAQKDFTLLNTVRRKVDANDEQRLITLMVAPERASRLQTEHRSGSLSQGGESTLLGKSAVYRSHSTMQVNEVSQIGQSSLSLGKRESSVSIKSDSQGSREGSISVGSITVGEANKPFVVDGIAAGLFRGRIARRRSSDKRNNKGLTIDTSRSQVKSMVPPLSPGNAADDLSQGPISQYMHPENVFLVATKDSAPSTPGSAGGTPDSIGKTTSSGRQTPVMSIAASSTTKIIREYRARTGSGGSTSGLITAFMTQQGDGESETATPNRSGRNSRSGSESETPKSKGGYVQSIVTSSLFNQESPGLASRKLAPTSKTSTPSPTTDVNEAVKALHKGHQTDHYVRDIAGRIGGAQPGTPRG